ncbi:MAG: hypothetical protein D6776_02410 [Planctomycetota bacterium]|nr:MAG: hypothetical protein D6776_02410 [Planctomycetota bacterium]
MRAHARFLDARVGRSGLEASLEPWLSGVSGGQLVERDRRTGRYRVVSEQPPIPGRDVRLHVDAALQRQLERILDEAVERAGGRGGAAVLLGARTGAVRVLASSPRFEIDRIGAAYRRWRDDPRAPLVHRAIAAQLPPGSTVKPIMVLAALAQGGLVLDGAPVRGDRRFVCRGYLYNRHAFQCHARYGHGPLTLAEALERSCNIPFYRIGEALGPEALATWYRRFGFGRRSGIDLPGERPGLVPTPRWKSRRLEAARSAERRARTRLLAALRAGGGPWRGAPWRARLGAGSRWDALQRAARRWRQAARWAARCEEDGGWRKGDSRNAAIGQGNVLATPLQLAVFAAALANGGRLVRPEVAGLRLEASAHRAPELALEPAGLAVVREGMRLVTSGAHGTARPSVLRRADTAIDEATIALWRHAYAKTGTAQAGAVSHAWIVGWLPAPAAGDEPLAFCVLVEGIASGGGGSVAGPVAARMLRLAVAREGAP